MRAILSSVHTKGYSRQALSEENQSEFKRQNRHSGETINRILTRSTRLQAFPSSQSYNGLSFLKAMGQRPAVTFTAELN